MKCDSENGNSERQPTHIGKQHRPILNKPPADWIYHRDSHLTEHRRESAPRDGRTACSGVVLERFHRAAPSQHEGIGDELERREVDVGLTGRGEFNEMPVEPGIFGLGGVDQ
jgi:hypothetical protein